MGAFLNGQARVALRCLGHKYHQAFMKCGKGDLAGMQSSSSLIGKSAQTLRNPIRQDFGNQRVSTRLNLNGNSACRVNGLALPPV